MALVVYHKEAEVGFQRATQAATSVGIHNYVVHVTIWKYLALSLDHSIITDLEESSTGPDDETGKDFRSRAPKL